MTRSTAAGATTTAPRRRSVWPASGPRTAVHLSSTPWVQYLGLFHSCCSSVDKLCVVFHCWYLSQFWYKNALLQFEPKSGPVQGGTRVTIQGHNFGASTPNDPNVKVKVTVALVDCVIEERNSSRWVTTGVKCLLRGKNSCVSLWQKQLMFWLPRFPIYLGIFSLMALLVIFSFHFNLVLGRERLSVSWLWIFVFFFWQHCVSDGWVAWNEGDRPRGENDRGGSQQNHSPVHHWGASHFRPRELQLQGELSFCNVLFKFSSNVIQSEKNLFSGNLSD